MVFQAFVDESEDQDGIIVLAGYVATAEAWAVFSKEWERLLLPYGTLAKNGRYHFKMSEMAQNAERMARVPAFFRLIEQHAILSIGAIVKKDIAASALRRLWVPGLEIEAGFLGRPYLVAWRALFDTFHIRRLDGLEKIIPLDKKVDFIFDERTEKAHILPIWNLYVADKGERIRELYGAAPRFENDQDFLPLQAADFWAWWLREWAERDELWRIKIPDLAHGEALRTDRLA